MKYSFEIENYTYSEIIKKILNPKRLISVILTPLAVFFLFYFFSDNVILKYISFFLCPLILILSIGFAFKSYVYKIEFDENKIRFHKNFLSYVKSYEWDLSQTDFTLKIPHNPRRLSLSFEIVFENRSGIYSPNEFWIYDINWQHSDLYEIFTKLKKLKNEETDNKQLKNLELLQAEIDFVSPF